MISNLGIKKPWMRKPVLYKTILWEQRSKKIDGKAECDSDVLKCTSFALPHVSGTRGISVFHSSSKECIYTQSFMGSTDFTEDFVGNMEKDLNCIFLQIV